MRAFGSHPRDVKPARLSFPAEAGEHEYALAIELPVLSCLGAEALPGAAEVSPAVRHLRRPRPPIGRWTGGEHVLDAGVPPVDPCHVAAFPVRVNRAHEVQVLRHVAPVSRARAAWDRL